MEATGQWIVIRRELMLCAYTKERNQKELINLLVAFNGQMLKGAKDSKDCVEKMKGTRCF